MCLDSHFRTFLHQSLRLSLQGRSDWRAKFCANRIAVKLDVAFSIDLTKKDRQREIKCHLISATVLVKPFLDNLGPETITYSI